MARRRNLEPVLCPVDLPDVLGDKLAAPLALILGCPKEWLPLLELLQPDEGDVTAYAMDLFAAEELRAGLKEIGIKAGVVAAPDLWDLPGDFQTAIYAPPAKGERELKIDMVE